MSENLDLLLVDDDPEIGALVRAATPGYTLHQALTAAEGRKAMASRAFDLMLIDITLPDGDGFHLCNELSNSPVFGHIPLIILSAHQQLPEIVLGLKSGADDYIVKPFFPMELQSRIEARLRRKDKDLKRSLRVGPLEFNLETFSGHIAGDPSADPLRFTKTEFQILYTLAKHANKLVTRDQLVETIWKSEGISIDVRGINTHIAHIRSKLGEHATMLQAQYGRGYTLCSSQEMANQY